MPNGKLIRLKKGDANTVTRAIARDSDRLIATYGLRLALVIARGMLERIQATYEGMERKYGDPKEWS